MKDACRYITFKTLYFINKNKVKAYLLNNE